MIKFYSPRDPFGAFSNFARFRIFLDGKAWDTTEHYYQAMKFTDPDLQEKIRKCPSPRKAADLGRSMLIRADWESGDPPLKYQVMVNALMAKFTQYESLKQLLLSTKDHEIIEASPTDYVWGCGRDGSGKNLLGKALMNVRDLIRETTTDMLDDASPFESE